MNEKQLIFPVILVVTIFLSMCLSSGDNKVGYQGPTAVQTPQISAIPVCPLCGTTNEVPTSQMTAILGTATTVTPTATSTITPIITPTETPTPTQTAIYKFGDKVVIGNFSYTFLANTTTDQLGGEIVGYKQALGIFMIFDLEIENLGNEPAYLLGSQGSKSFVAAIFEMRNDSTPLLKPILKIIDYRGRKYERDFDAELNASVTETNIMNSVKTASSKLQPNLPRRFKIVFDVPKDVPQNQNGLIEISEENLLTSEKKYISWPGG